ncbi:zinc finger BED domain-containing protein RICESLEEPER 1-like [Tasmannia lanceolata]|uniref:zinc finger BED domain-containing protein RICESLEEPER 1-like n=1 Tax=Tasmannia lanceolata TaxID=3420 RepID=UPI004062A107
MSLRMDVSTRRNATFLMLESAIKYRLAFQRYAMIEPGYNYCPSIDERTRGEEICKMLKPFYDITMLLSGSDYPTANLYFQCVWKIQIRLLEEKESEDVVISSMSDEMITKFEKYWESYSVVLAMAAILDPRYKMNVVEFCYKKINDNTYKEKVACVLAAMNLLFEEYVSQFSVDTSNHASAMTSGDVCIDDDFSEFDYYESEFCTSKKSELDLYLEETKFDHKQKLNVLEYWKDNAGRYPILSKKARDLMSVPITTVATESAFSIGAKVLTKYRSSLRPENTEAVICTRNWLFGYQDQCEDPTDEQLVVPLSKVSPLESRGSTNTNVI